MLTLNLNLLPIKSEYPRIDGELVGIDRSCCVPEAYRPPVMRIFAYQTPGVSSRVRGKIICGISQKGHAQKLPPEIAGVGILVEEVDHTEIANPDDEAPAVHGCAELHRVRIELNAIPAKSPRLLEK